MTQIVTRIAPSPTGYMHIGTARTALFNWLFARHHGGKFLLRIEDTDRKRSTPEATEAILKGMEWLGLDWDEEPVSQFSRLSRHAEVARQMLENGTAYKCFSTSEEISAFREQAKKDGKPSLFQSPWRDKTDHPENTPFVVRLKAPQSGETSIKDAVQGDVTWKNETLDDMVLLRSDGTPTYMLAVVVDDFDMGITHVIRGDDHLTNAARQTLLYQANGWELPIFAHIPLIYGPDGKKLSKRHGAMGVEEYQALGYYPEAVLNYLARLGWSHGDDEFFTTQQAIEWFSLDGIVKSPARFDFKKLDHLSGLHIRQADNQVLLNALEVFLASQDQTPLTSQQKIHILEGFDTIKERAKTFHELIVMAHYILGQRPFVPDEKADKILDTVSRGMLKRLTSRLRNVSWSHEILEAEIREFAEAEDLKLGKVAQPIRAALTGRTVSPSVFDMMLLLGKDESIARLEDAAI